MGDRLTVSVSSMRGCAVVALAGESDVCSVGRWRDVLAGLVEAGPSRVVVDLSRLTFMGVAGARLLIEMDRALMARGGLLAVAGARGEVARVLELTGADQWVPVYRDVRAAVAGRVPFRLE